MFKVSSKISHMSKRRQKIALKKRINTELKCFVGKPNSQIVRAEVSKVLFEKNSPVPNIEVLYQPVIPVDHIDINIIITKQKS